MKTLQEGHVGSAQPSINSVEPIDAIPLLSSRALETLDLISTPVWLWDPHSSRIVWGNRAAIGFWVVDDLEGFRKVSTNVAQSTIDTLAAYAQATDRGTSTSGLWVTGQNGRSTTLACSFIAVQGDTGGLAFLVEPDGPTQRMIIRGHNLRSPCRATLLQGIFRRLFHKPRI